MADDIRILAIESSGQHGSAATLLGNTTRVNLVGQSILSAEQRTAQSLAPAIKELLVTAGWTPKSIQFVAVTTGPGSFTGLRIGVTMAKTFAYAVGAEVQGVNTLDLLAAQAGPSPTPLWTVIDAQRQELFAAKFRVAGDFAILSEHEPAIISQDRWLAELQPGEQVTGPALKRLAKRLPIGVACVAEQLWHPMAEHVGRLAWHEYCAGRRDDVWNLSPNYYRLSAAEEKRLL